MILDSLAETPSSLVIYGTDREKVVGQLTDDQAALVDWRQGGWGAVLLLTKSAPQVNLRQGSFAPPLPLAKWWGVWKTVAIAASVALSLQFVSDISQFQKLKTQNLELRSAIQDSYRKAILEARWSMLRNSWIVRSQSLRVKRVLQPLRQVG